MLLSIQPKIEIGRNNMPIPSFNFGWVEDKGAVEKVLAAAEMPYLGACSHAIKDTGAGKKQLLYKFVEQLNGHYPNRHQGIGDCFVKDTKVLMSTGQLKHIQDIEVGEYVITHNSRPRKVLRTISKPYSGKLITLGCTGYAKTITSTPDHQFITYKNSQKKPQKLFDNTKWNWKSAEDCELNNDCLLLPFGLQNNEIQYVYYEGQKIEVDENFARFIGLYLAEGGTDYGRITFNLCVDEDLLAEEIIAIGDKIFNITGRKEYSKIKQNVLLVRFYSVKLEKFIKSLIPGNLYNKNVPLQILQSPKIIKLACLRGWVDGDGHNYRKSNRITGVSASHSLIEDMYVLSASCELNPSLYQRKQAVHQTVASQSLDFYSDCAKEIYPSESGMKMRTKKPPKFTPLGIARKITIKEESEVENINVYCLEVEEDSSFIANGYAVHNCVSMIGAGGTDVLTCVEILMKGDLEEFEGLASSEFLYAGSRVTIGKGFYRDDGSNGGWLVEFMQKYGILLQKKYDDIDLTKYDPNRAREWGAPRVGPPQKLFKYSKEHCIQTYSQVTTAEEARDAIFNGFPVLVCSNQGFSDRRDSEGFARPQGTWPHALLVTAMDFEYKRPGFLIQNSWGEWNSGPTRHEQPVGSFWCDADVFEKHMLRANDSWVISNYKGYPLRPLDWGNLFR